MASLSEVRVGDIGQGLARYRPVALVVAVILLAAWMLPSPVTESGDDTEFSQPTGQSRLVDEPDEPNGDPVDQEIPAPDTSFTPPVAGSGSFGDDFDSGESFSYTPPPPSSTFTPPSFGDDDDGDSTPLTITASAWASRTAGTPIADVGVPADTLPVGTRVGQIDKASFIRLAGGEEQLRLKENASGKRTTTGTATVQACRVAESGWEEAEAMSFSEAPEWSADDCILGERSEDGMWTFDLGPFDDRTDDRGFALVPGPGAPADFQVAFEKQAA